MDYGKVRDAQARKTDIWRSRKRHIGGCSSTRYMLRAGLVKAPIIALLFPSGATYRDAHIPYTLEFRIIVSEGGGGVRYVLAL